MCYIAVNNSIFGIYIYCISLTLSVAFFAPHKYLICKYLIKKIDNDICKDKTFNI